MSWSSVIKKVASVASKENYETQMDSGTPTEDYLFFDSKYALIQKLMFKLRTIIISLSKFKPAQILNVLFLI